MKRTTVVLLALTLLVWGTIGYFWYTKTHAHKGLLTIAFLDIGQGDAVYIETPEGKRILYDAGPDSSVIRRLSEVMPKFLPAQAGAHTFDMIVLSHPDQDHVAGFSDVLRRFDVKTILDSGYVGEVGNPFYKDIFAVAKEKQIPVLWGGEGTTLDLGGGVKGEILSPDGKYSVGDTNIASIVLKLTYGSSSVLLSGDLPSEKEESIVAEYGSTLDIDIFKAGHHGSNTSSGEKFLLAMSPEFIIVSSGKNNNYGHPSKSVTDRFDRLGVPWMNTGGAGTIVLETDGHTWRLRKGER